MPSFYPGRQTRRFRPWLAAILGLAALLPFAGAKTDEAEEKQIWVILNRWISALGGAQNIAQLRTVDYRCWIDYGTGRPPIPLEVRATAEGAYRYDYELPGHGRLTQAFDGRRTWQRSETLGFGQLSAQEHALNQGGADFRAPLHGIKAFAQMAAHRLRPEETIEGRRLQVLEMADQAGEKARWYFDPESGLRVRVEADTQNGLMVVENSDFRRVPGSEVKESFNIIRVTNGQRVVITLRDIIYNEAVDPELLAPPRGPLEDNQAIERILHFNREAMGRAALKGVQTRVSKGMVEITTSGLKIPTLISQKQPNLMVVEQDVPGMGPMWQGFNGRTGWAWSELQGYREMQGAELQQMLASADLEGPLRLSEQCPLRRLLEEKEDNGRRLIGIALATLAGPAGNFYFDAKTYLLVRVETFIQTGASGQIKVVADYADFRKVDGMMLPFKTTLNNPAMQVVTTFETVLHNQPLDDAIFQPRKE